MNEMLNPGASTHVEQILVDHSYPGIAGTKQVYDARMSVELLTERYKDQIAGVLSCYDRIIIQGTVPGWCYASGMTGYFYMHQIRIFDYRKWAEPLRDALRENIERIAADNAIEIEFVREEFPEGRSSESGSEQARRASGRGVHFFGSGAVRQLQALA
jgi:hypothetical protein